MKMADDNAQEAIKTLLKFILQEPIFIGPSKPLIDAFSKMGLIGRPLEEVPGWLDNVAASIIDEDPVIYRTNRRGERVYARWYEIGEDGSVITALGNYLSFPLLIMNEILEGGPRAEKGAKDKISAIKQRHPTNIEGLIKYLEGKEALIKRPTGVIKYVDKDGKVYNTIEQWGDPKNIPDWCYGGFAEGRGIENYLKLLKVTGEVDVGKLNPIDVYFKENIKGYNIKAQETGNDAILKFFEIVKSYKNKK